MEEEAEQEYRTKMEIYQKKVEEWNLRRQRNVSQTSK